MNALSYDIKSILELDGGLDIFTYPISIGVIPEDASNCIVLIDVAGRAPQLTMDKAKYEFPSLQVKVQCTDYFDGLAQANKIVDTLHGRAHETWNGTYYSLITCLNGPGFFERVRQRTIFVINFNAQRR